MGQATHQDATHLSDLELLALDVAALFAHDANGRIRCDNEPDGARAPRFFLGRTRSGNLWRFRDDLPGDVVQRLEQLAGREPVNNDLRSEPCHLAALQEALGDAPGTQPVYFGPVYRFPDWLSTPPNVMQLTWSTLEVLRSMPGYSDDIARTFDVRQPVWVAVENGLAASLCFSSRRTDRVAEAGVETLAQYRGRGYASAVVAAWANNVRASGRIPLYGTTRGNTASQGVARKLGLIQFGSHLSL